MKTIKFRAWEKPGAVPHGNGWFEGKMHEVVPNHLNSFFDYCLSRPHEYELMQFTGRLDKNRKEIYEGDIFVVRTLHDGDEDVWNQTRFNEGGEGAIPQLVEWSERACGFKFGLSSRIKYAPYDFEVIGNIYENPDLLQS